jgi:hypothetical protein
MADTADRRVEGRGLPSKITLLRRVWTQMGVCNKCGKVEVVNRKTCYTCVDKQMVNQMRFYVRKAAKLGFVQIIREI